MTYRELSKWLKLMNNFIIGYNKMIFFAKTALIFSQLEKNQNYWFKSLIFIKKSVDLNHNLNQWINVI